MRAWFLVLLLLLTGCPDRDAALPAPKAPAADGSPGAKAKTTAQPKPAVKPAPEVTMPSAVAGKKKAAPGASTMVWKVEGRTQTFSSPRCADLNADGVLDVILGHGVTARDPARTGASGSVTAHDGRSGKQLWRYETHREVVSTATLADLNGDGVMDAAMGARDGVFFALDGKTGKALWEFKPGPGPGAPGRLNHYSPAIVPDVDGDGVVDLVQASGGDVSIPAHAARPPGHLLLVSGKSGELIAAARTPDGGETYTSPVMHGSRVIFGTGGETHPGSLWSAALAELRRGDLSGARQLVKPVTKKGFIAPASLADMTGDGVDDIVAASFDGRVIAVDGATGGMLWSHSVSNGETHFSPVIGQFVGSVRPDVAAMASVGTWPKHHKSVILVVDGDTGRLHERRWDFLKDPVVLWWYRGGRTPSTPWVGDLDGDGKLDWLHAHMRPPTGGPQQADHSFEAAITWALERRKLSDQMPQRVAWGAYLGTHGDGRRR